MSSAGMTPWLMFKYSLAGSAALCTAALTTLIAKRTLASGRRTSNSSGESGEVM